MEMSSPATSTPFTPRLYPRPQYPPFFREVLPRWVWLNLRDIILGVGLSWALFPLYARLAALFTERAFFALTICVAHTGTFIVFNGGLTLLAWLEFGPLLRCAIPRKPAEVPTRDLMKQLFTHGAINHFVTSPLAALALFSLTRHLGMPSPTAALPDVATLALLFAGAHTFNDFGFYWTHRALHSKLLYSRFHKQHHSFRGTVGAAAEFAGPLEAVVSNQLPTAGYLILLAAHPLVQGVWIVLRLTQTYEAHSGYDFSHTWLGFLGVTSNESAHHDHHHTTNLGNFGAQQYVVAAHSRMRTPRPFPSANSPPARRARTRLAPALLHCPCCVSCQLCLTVSPPTPFALHPPPAAFASPRPPSPFIPPFNGHAVRIGFSEPWTITLRLVSA